MESIKNTFEMLTDPYWLGGIPDMQPELTSLRNQATHAAQKDADLVDRYGKLVEKTRLQGGKLLPVDRGEANNLIRSASALSRQCAAMQKRLNMLSSVAMPMILGGHLDAGQVAPEERQAIIAEMLEVGLQNLPAHENLLEVLKAQGQLNPATLTQANEDRYDKDLATCGEYTASFKDKPIEEMLNPDSVGEFAKTLHTPAFARTFLLHSTLIGVQHAIAERNEDYRETVQTLSGGLSP